MTDKTIKLDGVETSIQSLIDGKVKIHCEGWASAGAIIPVWPVGICGECYCFSGYTVCEDRICSFTYDSNWQAYQEPKKELKPSERIVEIYQKNLSQIINFHDETMKDRERVVAIIQYLDEVKE